VKRDDVTLDTLLAQIEQAQLARRLVEPEPAFMFKHALVQEAAYESLLKQDRKRLHRIVGGTIERMYPDRLEELSGMLALHFAAAGERNKAIEYSRRAAQRAVAVYAYDEAAQHLRTALDLIEPGEPSETHLILLEELADVHHLLRQGARAIALYQEALDVWRTLRGADTLRVTAVRLHRKIVQMVADVRWSVDLEYFQAASQIRLASRASLETALPLMQGEPPHAETVRLLTALSVDAWRTQFPAEDWDAAQRFAQAAVDMAEQLDSPVDLSRALGALASVYDGRGLLRQHLQVALQRLAICEQTGFGDVREGIDALRGVGIALLYVGEYAQAIPYLQEAESHAGRIQALEQLSYALGLQGQCWFWLDAWDEALAIEDKWRDLERRYSRERIGPT
jgi:tetratricopeptide (TPR) repeat protein